VFEEATPGQYCTCNLVQVHTVTPADHVETLVELELEIPGLHLTWVTAPERCTVVLALHLTTWIMSGFGLVVTVSIIGGGT